MAILEVKNLHKTFGKTQVLKGINFELEEGQVMSIIGSSGSGKTTLLRCVTQLETADCGSIRVDGSTIFDSNSSKKLTAEEKLKNQLASAAQLIRDAESSVSENKSLKAMLGIVEANPDFEFAACLVVGSDQNGYSRRYRFVYCIYRYAECSPNSFGRTEKAGIPRL